MGGGATWATRRETQKEMLSKNSKDVEEKLVPFFLFFLFFPFHFSFLSFGTFPFQQKIFCALKDPEAAS